MNRKTDVLVIGGSAAGLTAALTARKHDKTASITLVRKEREVPIPCGIPYIFGTLRDVRKNLIPDTLLFSNNIELVVEEATAINRDKKTVSLSKGDEIEYDKLIIATGAFPVKIPIPGIDLQNVFFAKKDVEYLTKLLNTLETTKNAVIIGGGFIGVEFADEFRKRGINVTIVELLPHCLQLAYDEEFCVKAEEKLRERGVKILTNCKAAEIVGEEKIEKVRLSNGEEIEADLVLMGVGVTPNIQLARNAGLKIGEQRGIFVDEYMRTTDEDVFAIGDCAEKFSFFTKKPIGLRLASIATREARIAGANVYGLKRKNIGVIGSFSTRIGELGLGVAGLTEKQAKDAGFNVVIGTAKGPDKHPKAMGRCQEITVKLVFDADSNVLLGGQFMGGDTTAELTNITAFMIEKRMTMEEIVTFQFGTHPALTCSPIGYPIVVAAENAATSA